MAPPLLIDSALYRMKAYAGLLQGSVSAEQKHVGDDIATLVAWIEYARPLLGAVTPTAQQVNPFDRHGLSQNQYQGLQDQQSRMFDLNTAVDPKPRPEDEATDDTVVEKPDPPDPDHPVPPAEGGGDAEKPAA